MRYSEQQMTSALLDQPEFTGAPRKLFICSTPRSGSYLLCRFLINAGIGVPHEYFNPLVMREIMPRLAGIRYPEPSRFSTMLMARLGFAARSRQVERSLATYIQALKRFRSQSAIFATKVHFGHYEKILDCAAGHDLLAGGVFVYLYREDLLRQAVSAHFAHLTGRWSIDHTVTTQPVTQPDFCDFAKLDRTLQDLADEDRGWRLYLARHGIVPLTISYEALCRDPWAFVDLVAERLDMDSRRLDRTYRETEVSTPADPDAPSKREVAQQYLAWRGNRDGLARLLPEARPPAQPEWSHT